MKRKIKIALTSLGLAAASVVYGVGATQIGPYIGVGSSLTGITRGQVGAEPANANIQSHISSTADPHNVTKAQVGLGSVADKDLGLVDNQSKVTMFTSPTFTGVASSNVNRSDNGSVGGPAYSFTSSVNTGMYWDGASLNLGVAGTRRLELNSTFLEAGTTNGFRAGNGAQGSPTFHFGANTDTGLFYQAPGIGFAVDGVVRMSLSDTILSMNTINQIRNNNGSVGTPSYSFHNQAATGMYYDGALNFSLAGSKKIEIGAHVNIFLNADQPTAVCANAGSGGNRDFGGCSSSIRYKKDVEDLTDSEMDDLIFGRQSE